MSTCKRLLSVFLIAFLLSAVFPLVLTPAPAMAADSWVTMTSGTTEHLYSVWGSSCSNVFAVGDNGTILRYNGRTWTSMTSGTSMGLQGIWGSSATNVFAVGWSGTILHFDGTSWSSMTSGTPYDLYGVWGNAPNSVFAVGGMQTIRYWNGSTWTGMTTPGENSAFRAVWGTAYNNVYVVGNNGDIYHFDGTSWTKMTSATTNDLYAIWGSSASDIWAAGTLESSRVHYNGSAWSGGGMPNLEYSKGIWGTSGSNIYMAGHAMMGGGTIDRYNGSSWTGVTIPTSAALNGIWGSSNSDIFAVGDSGTILHYGGCPAGSTSAILNTTLGSVGISSSGCYVNGAAWIAPAGMRCSAPSGCIFPYGMFTFDTGIITTGQTGRITIQFPNPIPLASKYYNCTGGSMVDISSQVTRTNEYAQLLTLNTGGTYVIGACFAQSIPQSSSPSMPATPQAPVSLSNVTVKSASLSATKVTPGEKVTVSADVANTGTGNGTSVVKVYVNGSEASSQGVTVNSGGISTVSFTISRNEPGTYSVYVGGARAGSFTVDEFSAPNIILIVSSALIFFAMVIGVIYITRRRVS